MGHLKSHSRASCHFCVMPFVVTTQSMGKAGVGGSYFEYLHFAQLIFGETVIHERFIRALFAEPSSQVFLLRICRPSSFPGAIQILFAAGLCQPKTLFPAVPKIVQQKPSLSPTKFLASPMRFK